jgi:ferredoxin
LIAHCLPTCRNSISIAKPSKLLQALRSQTFFKLIAGASLTDPSLISFLTTVYALAGAHCIDVAADAEVLQAVEAGLAVLAPDVPRPLVMVSVALDPDPHFNKIGLDTSACIVCGACLPVCPTNAFKLDAVATDDTPDFPLQVSQPLCYGCNRCVPVCPTQALTLHPFLEASALEAVFQHPLVGAVEIHTRYADPAMLADFLQTYQAGLQDKLLSLCFRPQVVGQANTLACLQVAKTFLGNTDTPLIFQVDGQPMSGSDAPDCSQPAIDAALLAHQWGASQWASLTVSGGINQHTHGLLAGLGPNPIAGMAMGTIARQVVCQLSPQLVVTPKVIQQAQQVVCNTGPILLK